MLEQKTYKVKLVNKEDETDTKEVEVLAFGLGGAAISAERQDNFKYEAAEITEVE